MEEFIHFFQGQMEKPGLISWFHLVVLILVISSTIFVSCFFKNTSEKNYKRILFVTWVVLIVLGIFRQIIKAFHYGNSSYWEYSYKDFPFNLCSMIYYFTPIILFVNKEKHPKIVDTAIGYMCLFSLSAGILVCIYTNMAVSRYIYINFQTFIHHGAQVVLGVFIYVWNRKTITIKTYFRSLIAFGITVVMAIIINVSFYPHEMDMFFINPMFITDVPIGSTIQEKAGYPVYLIVYLIVVSLAAYLTYLTETSIYKLVEKKKAQALNNQA